LLTRWRKRTGEEGAKWLLTKTIEVEHTSGVADDRSLSRVAIDTTVALFSLNALVNRQLQLHGAYCAELREQKFASLDWSCPAVAIYGAGGRHLQLPSQIRRG
jgi:hypothetical protein